MEVIPQHSKRWWFFWQMMHDMFDSEFLGSIRNELITYDSYCVLTVQLRTNTHENSMFQYSFIHRLIEDICHEYPLSYMLAAYSVDQCVDCIILSASPSASFADDVHHLAFKLQENLERDHQISVSFCIGSVHYKADEFRTAYSEAKYTASYAHMHNLSEAVILHEQIKTQKVRFVDVPRITDIEKQYIDLMLTRHFVDAKRVVLSFYNKVQEIERLNNRLLQTIIFALVDMILKSVSMMDQRVIGTLFNRESLILGMMDITDLATLRYYIQYVHDKIIEYYDTSSMNSEEKIAAAKHYIHEHFLEAELCPLTVADALSISEQYLSKQYKKRYGQALSKEISYLRVDHAARLLVSNQQLSVEKVSTLSGFSNLQTFVRTFKRFMNMSPRSYREQSLGYRSSAIIPISDES